MNDVEQTTLRPASDNPWYWLATVYGEQPIDAYSSSYDEKLAEQNRIAWNRWKATRLNEDDQFDATERKSFTPEEKLAFLEAFKRRAGSNTLGPPEPAQSIDFSHNHFERFVCFDRFLFATIADFKSAMFSRDVRFRGATFSKDAQFNAAMFSSNVSFVSATFSEKANFKSSTFSESAGFSWVEFRGIADFSSVTFNKNIYFVNAKFSNKSFLANAVFTTSVPDFDGATLHEGTQWHGVTWPPPPLDKNAAQTQVYAYERLRREMERLKKYEDEQLFFQKEMGVHRHLYVRWSGPWIVDYLYEKLSGYGQSLGRPTAWLCVDFWAGFLFFAAPDLTGMQMTGPQALRLSFINVFSLLLKPIIGGTVDDTLLRPVQIVGATQSLFGALLLFLLGLALRNRFRMK